MQHFGTEHDSQEFLSSALQDGALWRLFVPRDDSATFSDSVGVLSQFLGSGSQKQRLLSRLELVYEHRDDNLEFLRRFVNGAISVPEPYLEKRHGGCSASVVYFCGSEMTEILVSLANS
ncbi:hypothetical protein TSA1_18040 [Bradyrhizobium nitroreducens]|uniref:Uncharacterized protein n=1 Tax=Bradyrhizobium nitroreducens TaxID=709803 RepID=A0A2M6UCW1_9BRAD|nr:hypothetical protein [Bradyrhizobium nitroreducens]PIT02444.1 hypothetical protein TSA1_18040 [Bradyrhizobium nitroreducens]